MKIADLQPYNEDLITEIAQMLVVGFRELAPRSWPDESTARAEVENFFSAGRVSRVAVGDNGRALGWMGGIRQYDGHVWELHPLIVHADHRGRGIGRTLVHDLERQVRTRGGLTLWVGSDDEADQTSLSGIDLYPDVLKHLSSLQNVRCHPYTFYYKLLRGRCHA